MKMIMQAVALFVVPMAVLLIIHSSTGKLYGVGYYQNRGWMFMLAGLLYLVFGFVMTRSWHF